MRAHPGCYMSVKAQTDLQSDFLPVADIWVSVATEQQSHTPGDHLFCGRRCFASSHQNCIVVYTRMLWKNTDIPLHNEIIIRQKVCSGIVQTTGYTCLHILHVSVTWSNVVGHC